jgi:peptidoglycan LD-endopeptidase LytH
MNTIILIIAAGLIITDDPVADWVSFEKAVRDQQIEKTDARKQFPILYKKLIGIVARHHFSDSGKWVFPVQGYCFKEVGKGGFRPDIRYGSSPIKGYDFYDGNLHGGHPAYDIFTTDRNMDCLDDRTHRPIFVNAPIDLFVLSAFSNWKTSSDLRGGNYIWALDLPHNRLFYFAHLDSIIARSGEFILAGGALGTVGRSGKNAAASRSPTHLHMMVLNVEGAMLQPFDFWNMLEKK